VAESVEGDKTGMRVSDLIARGWLSGLGLANHLASSEGDAQDPTKLPGAEPHP